MFHRKYSMHSLNLFCIPLLRRRRKNKINDKMLPNQIGCILSFFDLFGFNSGSSKLFRTKYSINFIRFVHIVLAVLYTLSLINHFYKFFLSFGLTETINELVETLASLITYYLILLDAILHQRTHTYFWTAFQQIDDNSCGQSNFKLRSFIVKIVTFFSATTVMILIRIILSRFETFDYLIYMSIIKICQIRLLYYVLCLEVIYFQLEKIEQVLVKMKDILSVEHSETRNSDSFELQRLRWIRSYFHGIYNMVNALNESFGWSHVVAMPFCFFCLFTDLNYLYMHTHEISLGDILGKYLHDKNYLSDLKILYFSGSSLWIIHPILLVIYLFLGVTGYICMV